MPEATKRIVVVSPVHNRKDVTLQCLGSLARIDRSGLDIRTVIVDDGSTDGTADAIRREFPDVEIVAGDGNLWYTAGTNRGIEAALRSDPDYVLAINDDSLFDPMFLRRLVSCAESNPRSVVGPLLLLWNRRDRVFQVDARWDTWYGGWRHRTDLSLRDVPRESWEVEIIVGNCVLYPVAAIREVGLMDEKRFVQFGDAEYTPRMRKAGWRLLIDPAARVYCQPFTLPPSARQLPIGKVLNILFRERQNQLNLRTLFFTRWDAAPNRLLGASAFLITLVRLGLKWAGLARKWPDPADDWHY